MYDYIVQFIKSSEFNSPINDYVDNNCDTFDDKDENKLEHTNIHNKYKELIENVLTKMLNEIGCSPEQFVKCAEIGLKNTEDKTYFEQIIAVDNFLYFKAKFVKKNYELKESSYKLMYAAENKNSQSQLTNDENYNILLKIKERNEYECALAMSLAMIEEKEKLGFDYDKDQEFIVSLLLIKWALEMSKNDTQNRSNFETSFGEKISIFDRNSLLQEHQNKKSEIQVTKQKEKDVPFSFGDINFSNNSNNDPKFKIGNTDVTNIKKEDTSKNTFGVSNEGSLNIEGKKIIDNNSTWKTGLNKQEDINLAILSTNNKKKEVDLFDQIGDLGSVSFKEKIEVKQEYKSEYVDEFEESSKNKLSKQLTIDESANSKLEKLLNSGAEIKFDEQGRYFDVNTGKWILPDYSKQNQDLFDRIKKLRSSLDNKADISGMLKWKNNQGKVNLDQPLPDLSNVKSKLNTGIIKKKMTDDKFGKEAEKYKKQLDDFNKENDKKMRDFREQAIKLDKAKTEDELRKEMKTKYAEKLTGK